MKKIFVILTGIIITFNINSQVVVKRKTNKKDIFVKPKINPKPSSKPAEIGNSRTQGLLLLECTLASTVYVNGEKKTTLEANVPKKINVEIGDNLIDVISIDGLYKERKHIIFEDSKQKYEQIDLLYQKENELRQQAELNRRNEEINIQNEENKKLDLIEKQNRNQIDDFKINKNIEWVSIQGGTFMMGSPLSELERDTDETHHQVTVASFNMSKYEVTFTQFDAFCEVTGRQKPDDKGYGRGKRPVINVSWEDAKAFAQWIGARLPSEAEWEYACRAGSTTPYNLGNNLNQANFNSNKTMPVGSYLPNAWGLYDMHGNVDEWCSNYYEGNNEKYKYNRVYRGGNWSSLPRFCRSAYRGHIDPTSRFSGLGFRIVTP
jgi:sulfatase modifying factor 1